MRLDWMRSCGAALLVAAAVALPVSRGAAQAAMAGGRRLGVLPPAPARSAPLGDTARAVQLLERATFGVTRESLAEVLRLGPEAWLDRQLHPERIDDGALGARLAAFPAATMEVAELMRAYPPPGAVRRARAAAGGVADSAMAGGRKGKRRLEAMDAAGFAAPDSARARRAAAGRGQLLAQLAGARLARAVHSERQLEEVMTDFWFNHFNVFVGKGLDRYLVAAYEREAIRPYVFGKFEDMLRATARHPAMLFYLDNWQNASPDTTDPRLARQRERLRAFAALTPEQQQRLVDDGRIRPEQLARLRQAAAQMGKRKLGLNENYARELMELHTLGVDGGYTQQDVIAVARAFTGWTISRPGARAGAAPAQPRPRRGRGGRLAPRRGIAPAGRPAGGDGGAAAGVRFVFRAELHDRGPKTVLGKELRGQGEDEGLEVLHRLATSPATARHIARKLAVRFVSDDPPQALVDRLAGVFLESGGDLRQVTRALFTSPELYAPENYRVKVKTPLEVVASALRATGAEVGFSRGVLQALRTLGQVPYGELAPTGYPAASDEWVNSGAMLNRMNFALALAAGRLDGVRVDGAPVRPDGGADPVPALAAALLPGQDTRALQATVRAELAKQPDASPRARAVRAAGLILGSPDFQRR
ncbi:MAG TPA: DUF1800 domain-containing protein [Longimicrobiales bacterium]|nr:DUF1800 domain-containing protein [Longimicrobiales bacterium]